MTIYTPYTYLIGWSDLSKFYYGVRYAKECHPDELWSKYFTSSKHVARFRNKYGEPDIVQIRRTFSDREDAKNWENKVLLRMNARDHPKLLNATNNRALDHDTEYDRATNLGEYILPGPRGTWEDMYGIEKARRMKEKTSIRSKGNRYGGFKRSDETKKKMSTAAYLRWSDPEYRRKSSFRWITDGKVTVRLYDENLPAGWKYGRHSRSNKTD